MLRPELEQHEIANQERRQEVEKENLGGEDHRGVSYERGAKAPLRYELLKRFRNESLKHRKHTYCSSLKATARLRPQSE